MYVQRDNETYRTQWERWLIRLQRPGLCKIGGYPHCKIVRETIGTMGKVVIEKYIKSIRPDPAWS